MALRPLPQAAQCRQRAIKFIHPLFRLSYPFRQSLLRDADHDGGLRGGAGVPGKRLTWPWKRRVFPKFPRLPAPDGDEAPYCRTCCHIANRRLDAGRCMGGKREGRNSPSGARQSCRLQNNSEGKASRPASRFLIPSLSRGDNGQTRQNSGVVVDKLAPHQGRPAARFHRAGVASPKRSEEERNVGQSKIRRFRAMIRQAIGPSEVEE